MNTLANLQEMQAHIDEVLDNPWETTEFTKIELNGCVIEIDFALGSIDIRDKENQVLTYVYNGAIITSEVQRL